MRQLQVDDVVDTTAGQRDDVVNLPSLWVFINQV